MNNIETVLYSIADYVIPGIIHRRISFSQEGEDLVLASFYETKKRYRGFYIDIGAHHPFRFSNTAFFYKRGWRGINIEPTPHLFKKIRRYRRRDISLNLGCSNNGGTMTFYQFDEDALNTFDKEYANLVQSCSRHRIKKTINIETLPLKKILDDFLPQETVIDFFSIDAEGMDYEILESNDWNKYRPFFILVENTHESNEINQLGAYLHELGYDFIAKTQRTAFYRRNDWN